MAAITGKSWLIEPERGGINKLIPHYTYNMTRIMVKYQNIKPCLKVGTENRPQKMHYFFD